MGIAFTSKLEGMFKDMALSQTIMEEYKQLGQRAVVSLVVGLL